MDLDLIGVTASSISAIQPMRPRSGGGAHCERATTPGRFLYTRRGAGTPFRRQFRAGTAGSFRRISDARGTAGNGVTMRFPSVALAQRGWESDPAEVSVG